MAEVTRLASVLGELSVDVRSLVLAPHGPGRYAAFVRVATIDVPGVRSLLRGKGFTVAELSDFYEPG
jgi:hypothetical protein